MQYLQTEPKNLNHHVLSFAWPFCTLGLFGKASNLANLRYTHSDKTLCHSLCGRACKGEYEFVSE